MQNAVFKRAPLLIGSALSLAILASPVANADPVLVGPQNNPTGIDGLVVDGTTYNVTFTTDPTKLNTFVHGTALSSDANAALANALNALGVTELGPTVTPEGYLADVDNSLSLFQGPACFGFFDSFVNIPCPANGWLTTDDGGSWTLGNNGSEYVVAADFTTVPEPLSLTLFGTGLAGVIAMRRRRKIDSQ